MGGLGSDLSQGAPAAGGSGPASSDPPSRRGAITLGLCIGPQWALVLRLWSSFPGRARCYGDRGWRLSKGPGAQLKTCLFF